ncbi:hypothetical protein Scep_011696 [Stephania cephalantha]|uniref:Uncharacterized protein n=1 Tax=Stephania cephalantha TaxID=152367 RepID=A0AAP0JFM1_9MAGN
MAAARGAASEQARKGSSRRMSGATLRGRGRAPTAVATSHRGGAAATDGEIKQQRPTDSSDMIPAAAHIQNGALTKQQGGGGASFGGSGKAAATGERSGATAGGAFFGPIDPRRDNNGGQGIATSTKLDDARDSNGF